MKCSCSAQSSKNCIERKCKSCCTNVECKRHAPQCCKDCGEMYIIDNYKYKKQMALLKNKCFKCSEGESKICAVCKTGRLDIYCVSRNCVKCCTEESCNVHLNVNNWCNKCKKTQRRCINNNCMDCYCDDTSCKVHYHQCDNCPTMIILGICNSCKCCCRNWKCSVHFIVDGDVNFELLNQYKCTLHHTDLPVPIIDKIVNNFLNVIVRCKDCARSLPSLNSSILNKIAFACDFCYKFVCADCVQPTEEYSYYHYCNGCVGRVSQSEDGGDNYSTYSEVSRNSDPFACDDSDLGYCSNF